MSAWKTSPPPPPPSILTPPPPAPSRSLAESIDQLASRLADLIHRVHPVVAPIIDSLGARSDRDDSPRPARQGALGPSRSLDARACSRAVLPKWRVEILTAQHHRCAACGGDLHALGHHIDHVIPFSRGGTSDHANLQALCPPCNLTKGNR